MTPKVSPKIEVLGVYSPRENVAEFRAFVDREVASQNPVNFSAETIAFFKRVGREADLEPLPEEALREIREEVEAAVESTTLIEVLVTSPDSKFSVGDFMQRDPAVSSDQWQVAWKGTFLSVDGERVLGEPHSRKYPDVPQYRLAFYIHFWKPELPLSSSYGPLPLPAVKALPTRLWTLVPYELVD